MCNNCGCDPCNSGCGGCKPACNKTYFNLQVDPYDSSYWLWEMGCENGRFKAPSYPLMCPSLSIDYSNSTLNLAMGSCDTQKLTGAQLGSIINLNDLRDVSAEYPDACSLLVYNPGCGECPCSPDEMMWKKYVIPDAGTSTMTADNDGYYKVLVKGDCGCIKESRLPVIPSGMTALNYMRDSVPDDPDFPWYYGAYNDTINLHLAENASQYFGKFALKVTVNYGIQVCKSVFSPNANFRSLVCPVVQGDSIRVTTCSSILQGNATYTPTVGDVPGIPWGTQSLRGSFVFIVPKGKEAYLHHEFRLRTIASVYNYATNPLDGQRVPDEIAGQVDKMAYIGSRLNALQIIVEPTQGSTSYNPTTDTERNQLDPAVDEYPPISG